MTATKTRAVFGIVGLAMAGLVASSVSTVGCSDDGGGGQAGTTGNAGSGGTTGNAGTGGGSTVGCQMSAAPASALISDFSTAVIPIGGTFVYGTPSPVATPMNGGLNITLTAPGMDAAQYLGAGIYFNGNAEGTFCVDASAYTGIRFKISGTVGGTGCTAQYSTNDSAHSAVGGGDMKASGPAGSYAPQAPLTVTATPTTVMFPFTGAGAPTGGSPMTDVDKMKLTGMQLQFTVAAGAANSCMVDIVIDDVEFY